MAGLTDGEAAIWRQMFDLWRHSYDQWTYRSHQLFYNMVAKAFPVQAKADEQFILGAITYTIAACGRPISVWELGGWDGALAKKMIEDCEDRIEYWFNFEICDEAIRNGWDDGTGVYLPTCKSAWAWDFPPPLQDIAILSHVIEHLSWEHLQSLVRTLRNVPFIYIQTPSSMGNEAHPTRWMGTLSTHKLEVGWNEVYTLLYEYDYTEIWHEEQARFFCKLGGLARA